MRPRVNETVAEGDFWKAQEAGVAAQTSLCDLSAWDSPRRVLTLLPGGMELVPGLIPFQWFSLKPL